MEGSNFPLIKDVDHVLAGHCEKRRGGDMFIRPPGYSLSVTNPADSGDIPPDNTVSAQGTTPQPVSETTTIIFVEGTQLIPGPPGPTGPAGSTRMPTPIQLTIVGGNVFVDAVTPPGTVLFAPIYFRLTLTQDVNMTNPVNGADSQRLIIEALQDSVGGHVITWGSDFGFGTDIPFALQTAGPGKRDFYAFVLTNGKWDCVGVTRGY